MRLVALTRVESEAYSEFSRLQILFDPHNPKRFFFFRQHSRSHPHYRYSGCDLLSKAPFYYPLGSPTTPRHQFFLAMLPVVLYDF